MRTEFGTQRGGARAPIYVLAAARGDGRGHHAVVPRTAYRDCTATRRRAAVRGHLWATLEEAAGAREAGPATESLADAGVSLSAIVGNPEGHLDLLKDLEQRQQGGEGAVYVPPVRQQGWWMLVLKCLYTMQ